MVLSLSSARCVCVCFFFVLIVLSWLLPCRLQLSSVAFAAGVAHSVWLLGLCWLHAWCLTQCVHLSSYSQYRHHHPRCFAAYQNNDITANTHARTHIQKRVRDTNMSAPYGQMSSFGPLRLSNSVSCLQHVKWISTQAWLLVHRGVLFLNTASFSAVNKS